MLNKSIFPDLEFPPFCPPFRGEWFLLSNSFRCLSCIFLQSLPKPFQNASNTMLVHMRSALALFRGKQYFKSSQSSHIIKTY